jgi:hypothetical protein
MLVAASIVLAAGTLLGALRYGTQSCLPVTGALSLLLTWLFDASVGAAPLIGIIAAVQIERQRGYGEILAAAAAPGALLGVWVLLSQDARARVELSEALTGQLQAMGVQSAQGALTLQDMVASIVRLQPGLEYVSLLLIALLAYRVACWAAPRLQLSMPPALPFRLWRPWEELIWVLVGSLAVSLTASDRLGDLGLNVALVMGVVYAAQGVALIRFVIQRFGIARFLELTIYVMLFFTSGLSSVVLAALGLLDTWFDWRRLRSASTGDNPE